MVRKARERNVTGSSRTSVEVLLAENVEHLGDQGDIVRVKPGYARNFLLPHGLATVATEHNKRMVELHRQKQIELERDRIKNLRKLREDVQKYSVTIEANANEEGHLYGSVVDADISKALKNAGYAVESNQIHLEGPLKELGMYTVKFQLHEDVKGDVKVWVVPMAK
ncbi:MAG TPA: 50S ribosomal protein L9 [Planctomycetaceae bacterium]|nr:50S ribosomal protein L9 [Planctomycetaceae bacterium]